MHIDQSKMLADIGIKVSPIHFGKHKVDGNPYEPLSKQGRETMQEKIDSYGNLFVDAVARHRNTTPDGVRSNFGDGKCFIGAEALKRNMIDAVGSIRLSQSTSPEQIVAAATNLTPSPAAATEPNSNPTGNGSSVAIVTEEPKVKRLKAMMFGLGMIASLDANDETATAAMVSFCVARGETLPKGEDGSIVEDKAIALLLKPAISSAAEIIQPAATPATPAPSAAQAARDQEIAEAVAAADKRREDIEAHATLVNLTSAGGELVSREDINAAIKSGDDVDKIRGEWSKKIGSGDDGGSLIVGVSITPGRSSSEKFGEAATLVLLARSNAVTLSDADQKTLREFRGDVGRMSMLEMAKQSLILGNNGQSLGGGNDDIAQAALSVNPGRSAFASEMSMTAGPAFNRPGDFGNILSNLAGKTLDAAMTLSRTTYQRWSHRLPDANNFKASTFLAIGSFTMLDDVRDGDDYQDLQASEEYRNYVSVNEHANTVKMTPRMVVDDDLDAFMQMLLSLGYAHDNTINETHVKMLNANPMLPDGKRLFDVTRGNMIAAGGGGAPSKIQAEKMKLAHYGQTGIDTAVNIETEPTLALVPSQMETPAMQTYAPFGQLPEMKQAELDGEINVHRGTLRDGIVRETHLDRYDKSKWYTLDMMIRVFGHQFLTGFGGGGQRNTWFNNNNGCRHYSLKGVFGVAAFNPRGIVLNAGQ